jgi:purine nucleosidase
MQRMIIDTDTASDDAVALVMALRSPHVVVEAITVVAGNVPLAQAVQNALYTVELCGAETPVYVGRHAPLLRALETAQNVHGADGMGDIGLPLVGRVAQPEHAVDVLVRAVDAAPGALTLVALGPLTNVAMAILRDPAFVRKVGRCVIMGGAADGYGNVTPIAEYNAWADPEAAKIVFESGMPITMVGWDISRKYAVFTPDDVAQCRAVGTPLARFCMDIQGAVNQFALTQTQLDGFDLPDPIAMAVAIDPAVVVQSTRCAVLVDASDGVGRGQTILDHLGMTGRPRSVEVVLAADCALFVELLHSAVAAH